MCASAQVRHERSQDLRVSFQWNVEQPRSRLPTYVTWFVKQLRLIGFFHTNSVRTCASVYLHVQARFQVLINSTCLLLKLCSAAWLRSHSLGQSFMTHKSEGTPPIMAPRARTSASLRTRSSVTRGQSAPATGPGPRHPNAEVRR